MDLDPLFLSRIQFAFVVSFHILFPAFTIGLASWLAMLEALHLWTKRDVYLQLYQFWIKLFAVSFGLGVVSGIVMSYQFGTNWSRFTAAAGNIVGPLMQYEVVTAFFLEAAFLGIMLFGRGKVGPKAHFFATCMVALGTLVSTFWIISANSWMQTPAGYEIRDGIFYPTDWWAIVFNPSFPNRLVHMVLAAYLTTCFTIGGISAWHLWRGAKGKAAEEARISFSLAVWFAAIVAPLQILAGDMHGLNVLEQQPRKLAAIEGHWETHKNGAPLILFGIPDDKAEMNHYEVSIPKLGSFVLKHDWNAEIKGLKEWPREERPPMLIPFFTFRIMVGIGFAMLFVGFYGSWLRWRGRLYETNWFHLVCMAMTPSGFVAVLTGWYTAEVGRQPYVIYGLLRTADAVSPITGASVLTSLITFFIAYAIIFGAGTYYMLRIIAAGYEQPGANIDGPEKRPKRPMSLPEGQDGQGPKAGQGPKDGQRGGQLQPAE